MNYIKKLQQENEELKDDIKKIKDDVTDLFIYLQSSKFQEDNYVNRSDIFLRLENVMSIVTKGE
jgi:cell division protein FtsB